MTRAARFDDRLATGLTDLADPHFPDYFDDVLAVTARTRQRPRWTFPERWFPMVDLVRRPAFVPAIPWRTLSLLAALLLLAALAVAFAGSRPRLPAPFGPAANGLIPYDSKGDLFLGDLSSAQHSRPLLIGPEEDTDPAFSRSGTSIAFVRNGPAGWSLWTIRPDGTGARQLTAPTPGFDFWDWGPTDDRLFFTSTVKGVWRLQVVNADGSGTPTVIAPDLSIESFSFRPPTGSEMLVRGVKDGRAGLYVMNLDGTNRRLLLQSAHSQLDRNDLAQARFSPDGTQVAYQTADGAADRMWLKVIRTDGTDDRTLHWDNASFSGWPVWAADSKRIMFQRAFPTPDERFAFGHPLAIANADGSGKAREIGPKLFGDGAHAELSPDGTTLLVRTINTGTQILINPDTGEWSKVPWTSWSYPNWQRLPLP